jgi:hypothetical protein
LGDDLFTPSTDGCDDFIFTCKPTSYKTVYDFIDGAELCRHEERVRRRNTKQMFRYLWIEAVSPRDGKDATLVNWIGFEIVDAKGKAASPPPKAMSPRLSTAAKRAGKSRTRASTY